MVSSQKMESRLKSMTPDQLFEIRNQLKAVVSRRNLTLSEKSYLDTVERVMAKRSLIKELTVARAIEVDLHNYRKKGALIPQ